MFPYNS